MPSFFNKVLRRKKDEDHVSLLDGKFEEISPTPSPSATEFPELKTNGNPRGRGTERTDSRLRTFFRSRSRAASPTSPTRSKPRKIEELPPLPLNLFTEIAQDDSQYLLTEQQLGERKLTANEAVELVKVCSQAIKDQGALLSLLLAPHSHHPSRFGNPWHYDSPLVLGLTPRPATTYFYFPSLSHRSQSAFHGPPVRL